MMPDSTTKQAALNLLSRGLATVAEVASLSGESRQLVRWWARDLPPGIRAAYLAKQWKQARQAAEAGPLRMARKG
jgi:hypothetical protein